MVHQEIVLLCSDRVNSSLLNPSADSLVQFSWDSLYAELKNHCPILTQILKGGTRINELRQNQKNSIISMCISLMCNHRRKSMSLVQQVISILLYNGHCSKQVSLVYYIIISSAFSTLC